MRSPDEFVEHFVTLFDSRFLVCGLALHASLKRSAPNFHLWVICIDQLVEQQIGVLGLDRVSTIPLWRIETEELRAVKNSRTVGEYCWTLTPFAPGCVFDSAPDAERVTYLDADLYFFSSPGPIFDEFEASGKDVLITEHAYAPELDRTAQSGRFCVQFVTFRRTPGGLSVMKWWQERCVEWCYDRIERGRFGDQKYLDQWPVLFQQEVHVLRQVEKTLAPWNVDYFLARLAIDFVPIFYHFHSFRIVSDKVVRLYSGVRISGRASRFYDAYVKTISEITEILKTNGISVPLMPMPKRRWSLLRRIYMSVSDKARYASY